MLVKTRLGWDRNVAGMRREWKHRGHWQDNLLEISKLGDKVVDGKITLRCILQMESVGMTNKFNLFRIACSEFICY
jgi:hypothetical protein